MCLGQRNSLDYLGIYLLLTLRSCQPSSATTNNMSYEQLLVRKLIYRRLDGHGSLEIGVILSKYDGFAFGGASRAVVEPGRRALPLFLLFLRRQQGLCPRADVKAPVELLKFTPCPTFPFPRLTDLVSPAAPRRRRRTRTGRRTSPRLPKACRGRGASSPRPQSCDEPQEMNRL